MGAIWRGLQGKTGEGPPELSLQSSDHPQSLGSHPPCHQGGHIDLVLNLLFSINSASGLMLKFEAPDSLFIPCSYYCLHSVKDSKHGQCTGARRTDVCISQSACYRVSGFTEGLLCAIPGWRESLADQNLHWLRQCFLYGEPGNPLSEEKTTN